MANILACTIQPCFDISKRLGLNKQVVGRVNWKGIIGIVRSYFNTVSGVDITMPFNFEQFSMLPNDALAAVSEFSTCETVLILWVETTQRAGSFKWADNGGVHIIDGDCRRLVKFVLGVESIVLLGSLRSQYAWIRKLSQVPECLVTPNLNWTTRVWRVRYTTVQAKVKKSRVMFYKCADA